MNHKQPISQQIEQEISRQLKEFDRRLDRTGWLSVVLVIVLLFIFLALIMSFLQDEDGETMYYQSTYDYIEELEQRIDSLELEIEQLKANQ